MAREANQEDASLPMNSAGNKRLGASIRSELEKRHSPRVIVAISRCCITPLYCLNATKGIRKKARGWWVGGKFGLAGGGKMGWVWFGSPRLRPH